MGKRALIVDDSKSARLSLARILEKHAIEVDTAESAEQAIEYLGSHRPDAIFMDHMMPGMDGLQAVRAIKNNPRTATIPIMMYTSQEGELYVGEARALGAIGVLPKQIQAADVTKVLYQLNLTVDRRSDEQASFRPVMETRGAADDDAHTHASTHPLIHASESALNVSALREQLNDLRRMVLAGFDSQGDRLLADMHTVLRELHPQAATPAPVARRGWLLWVLTAALAGACAAFVALSWQQGSRLSSLQQQLSRIEAAVVASGSPAMRLAVAPDSAGAAAAAAAAESAAESAAGAAAAQSGPAQAGPAQIGVGQGAAAPRVSLKPIIQTVPFGAEPFSGPRLDAIRQLFDRLTAQGFQGNVDIRTYSGRFCLVGNATDGFSLAPDDLPYSRCDLVAGGRDEAAAGPMRIPVVMADLMGTLRASSHDLIHVQVSGGDGGNIAAYPPVSDTLTAGEWNRAAGANNRIEIHVR